MKKKSLIAAFVVVILFLNACTAMKTGKEKPSGITERYWKLTEVMGKPISKENNKEPHIILKTENNRLVGTGGCNSFSGSYELKDNGRISFSQVAMTRMACMNMETEASLVKVLESADNYTVNGNTLTLNKARMAPLAKFEAIQSKQ